MCRPRCNVRFTDIQHQDRALSILRRALRSGRTHHAYLFEGPEGVGKERAALALAARLLCDDSELAADADACGSCESCRMFAAETHPDFRLIHRGLHKLHPDRTIRSSKGLYLVVDVVRQFLIESAAMKPSHARRKVFLIRDAERMNEEAQNALLKTLEEPPGDARLVLVTSSAHRLLPTIRSRCQRIPFDLLPAAFVTERLVREHLVPEGDAAVLAGLAGGRLGVALHWHRIDLLGALEQVAALLAGLADPDPEAFGKGLVECATGLAEHAIGRSAVQAEDVDDELNEGGKKGEVGTDALRDALKLVLALVASLLREALLVRVDAPRLANRRLTAAAQRLAAGRGEASLTSGIAAVAQAEWMLDRNVAPALVGERLAVALLGEAGLPA